MTLTFNSLLFFNLYYFIFFTIYSNNPSVPIDKLWRQIYFRGIIFYISPKIIVSSICRNRKKNHLYDIYNYDVISTSAKLHLTFTDIISCFVIHSTKRIFTNRLFTIQNFPTYKSCFTNNFVAYVFRTSVSRTLGDQSFNNYYQPRFKTVTYKEFMYCHNYIRLTFFVRYRI